MQVKHVQQKRIVFCLIILLSVGPTLNAQQASLDGKWRMDWHKIYAVMTLPEKQRFDAMPQPMKNDITSNFGSKEFQFKKNNVAEVRWRSKSGEKIQTGSWEIYGSVLTLTIDGVPKQYTMSRNNDILILEMQNKMETALVSKLVLVKK